MPNYIRGWEIYWHEETETYRYCDTDEICDGHDNRPCKTCGMLPTPEGHDGCLGTLPGVRFACCGHGIEDGYISFENGVRVTLKKEQGKHDRIPGMDRK